MRCLIRADATNETGTGHVMRCLTLAEELRRRGHDVVLRGELGGIAWLIDRVVGTGVSHENAVLREVDWRPHDAASFDVVVVDSYEFDAGSVNAMARVIPTMAIVDGDDRGLVVDLYVDQNLGAHRSDDRRMLLGPKYALVREEIVQRRRDRPKALGTPAHIVSFMGGSDPTGAILAIARNLLLLTTPTELSLVVADRWRDELLELVAGHDGVHVIAPTPNLPDLLADADVVVSATGTSAWELCTIGIPAVFVAVADNQMPGYRALLDQGLALGVDFTSSAPSVPSLTADVERLLADAALRDRLFTACTALFDGQGSRRVADALERLADSGR